MKSANDRGSEQIRELAAKLGQMDSDMTEKVSTDPLKVFKIFKFVFSQTESLHGNRWRDAGIPKRLERTGHQMLCFYFYMFAGSFGGMVARAEQRAKAKCLGFEGTTAGRDRPGSRSTSLKPQQESSRAFLALLLLSPSLHSSLLSVITHTAYTPS